MDISENNCFIVANEVCISKEVIMNISISSNRLIVLKGYIDVKPLYKALANEIITDENLKSYIKKLNDEHNKI